MKKLISIVLLAAIVISCCACGKQNAEGEEERLDLYSVDLEQLVEEYQEEKKTGQLTDEELYGMIDQTVPVDGVYKIWNAEGVQNMADHPDADFEFLCSIDMEGATLRPIGSKEKPFTGNILGQNTILSNFSITESNGGYMGFIGYNKGTIVDIKFEDVTMVADANTQYIGGVAGYTEAKLRSVTVNGTMLVEQAAEGAVCGPIAGYTSGDVLNCVSDMDITYTAAGAATVGGFVGIAEGIRAEFTENYGALVVSGSNKTVGVIAGQAKDVDLYNIAFLGEKNEVDGKLCTEHFGQVDNQKIEAIFVRDNTPNPLPEKQRALRDKVVDAMYKMATVRWTTSEDLYHDCHCLLSICHGIYKPGMVHVGIPYNHYSTSLDRFKNCLDEDGYVKDWLYDMPSMDGYDLYFGNDCSGAVQQAWWTVSSTTDMTHVRYMQPASGNGAVPVGDWPSDILCPDGVDSRTEIIDLVDINVWYDAYAQVRAGDAYVHIGKDGNHTRMAQEDAVVVRDENGMINGDYSYIITVEQGAPATTEPYFCTWRYDYKYSFKNLILAGYMPVTCQELITGEMAPVECTITGAVEGRPGMTLGFIESNYNIDQVTLTLTDSAGNQAAERTVYPNMTLRGDFDADALYRHKNYCFDMIKFATLLRDVVLQNGETYDYTVSVGLSTGDLVTVHEGYFTNGQA